MNQHFSNAIRELRILQQVNDHSRAIVFACEFLGLDDLKEKAVAIAQQHERQGRIDYDLYQERREVYDKMMSFAKTILSAEDYKKFYMSF